MFVDLSDTYIHLYDHGLTGRNPSNKLDSLLLGDEVADHMIKDMYEA